VELSTKLGSDLQVLQRSHRKAVDLLHDRDLERIDRYIDQTVIPTYVKAAIDGVGPRLAANLDKALKSGATQADKDLVFDEMRKVVLAVSNRVERERKSLKDPVEEARKARLQELDMAYAQLQQANSVLTAHLASILKVNTVQDDLLKKAGLEDFRKKVSDAALDTDKSVDSALAKSSNVEDAIQKLKDIYSKFK